MTPMKQIKPRRAILILALIAIVFSCNKYKDTTPVPGNGELPEEKTVTASLQGRVVDDGGQPVADAVVLSGSASTTTDEHGVFVFTNVKMSSRFGFVKVTKDGYFAGSRSILATAGSENFVSIKLIPRAAKGSFAVADGGAVAIQTGASVRFDAASIVDAGTGAAYNGNVHVYASYLDPTAADVSSRMPGDLRGISGDGKETLLQSFGMMVVEMEGDAGQKLQIAGGRKATITMKIPEALKAKAPATIPLWYFNDTTGRWIEQGVAKKVGDQYVGETSHFSWWNCDAPTGAVSFHVRLKDGHGNPVAYTYLQFVTATMGTRGGYTDADGNASGLVPKGETMRMEALNSCGGLYFGVNAGPALTDLEMGTMTVTDDRAILTLTGTVVNCNDVAVDSGYVQAIVDGLSYRVSVVKGRFSLATPRCETAQGGQAALVVGDYKTLQQSNSISVPVTTSGSVDAGKLTACGSETNQYFNLVFLGKTYNYVIPIDSFCYYADTSLLFFAMPGDYVHQDLTLLWAIHAKEFHGLGTYKVYGSYVSIDQGGDKYLYYSESPEIESRPECTIKTFGAVNEFITGTLVGNYKDTTGVYHPLTCDFKVKRAR